MSSYVDDVLNAVYSGQKVLISFSSSSDRERFRQTLYRQKSRQDSLLKALTEEKKKTLKFLLLTNAALQEYKASIFLEDKTFSFQVFEIVEDEVRKEDAQKMGEEVDRSNRIKTTELARDLRPSFDGREDSSSSSN